MPTRPRNSASDLAEVEAALEEYCTIIQTSMLTPRTQAIYIDTANNFVRWLKFDFAPGYRKDPYPLRPKSAPPAKPTDCLCGHSAELHLYPESTLFGDCHECECELYNPPGGLKGVPIHPLFAFTEAEFRMVSCAHCYRFRVLPEGVCENCTWDNDGHGMVEVTRPDYCLHSATKKHEITTAGTAHTYCRYCLRTIQEGKTNGESNPQRI
jgi:hypothetical protein